VDAAASGRSAGGDQANHPRNRERVNVLDAAVLFAGVLQGGRTDSPDATDVTWASGVALRLQDGRARAGITTIKLEEMLEGAPKASSVFPLFSTRKGGRRGCCCVTQMKPLIPADILLRYARARLRIPPCVLVVPRRRRRRY